jgi:hypothetical protein
MSFALILINWQQFRFLQDFSQRDLEWLVIGAVLALLVTWLIRRQRRRWF